MVAIVIIQKNGDSVSQEVRDASSENLYKRVGLRSPGSFAKRVSWKVGCDGNSIYISLYAKDSGNAGQENKTELPPPIDKDLYFGKIAIVASKDDEGEETVDLPLEIWKGVRDQLFGGFEDLGDDDSSESEDDIAPEMLVMKRTGLLWMSQMIQTAAIVKTQNSAKMSMRGNPTTAKMSSLQTLKLIYE